MRAWNRGRGQASEGNRRRREGLLERGVSCLAGCLVSGGVPPALAAVVGTGRESGRGLRAVSPFRYFQYSQAGGGFAPVRACGLRGTADGKRQAEACPTGKHH